MDLELRRRRSERGFTVIEVLIALLVLLVGMAGVMTLQLTAMKATSFSRHATEASTLCEARMEALRTASGGALVDGADRVDAMGVADDDGLYQRSWTVAAGGATTVITVNVAWVERGDEPYTITMSTLRTP